MSGPPLTERERAVLVCRCVDDLTLNDTAASLGIAQRVVEETQTRIFRLLGKRSIAGTCYAFRALGVASVSNPRRYVPPMLGRKHTPETIERMCTARRARTARERKSA